MSAQIIGGYAHYEDGRVMMARPPVPDRIAEQMERDMQEWYRIRKENPDLANLFTLPAHDSAGKVPSTAPARVDGPPTEPEDMTDESNK